MGAGGRGAPVTGEAVRRLAALHSDGEAERQINAKVTVKYWESQHCGIDLTVHMRRHLVS